MKMILEFMPTLTNQLNISESNQINKIEIGKIKIGTWFHAAITYDSGQVYWLSWVEAFDSSDTRLPRIFDLN